MKSFFKITILLSCCLLSTYVFAQQDPSSTPGGGVQLDVPLDGCLSLLVAAGVLYGIKKKEKKHK
ncbi:MAG: hypothetical protein RL624_1405 [Bacteroidota bacterium]|jgi:hypothetical protein